MAFQPVRRKKKRHKTEVLETHLLAATLVPLMVMERSLETLDILEVLAEKGSRLAVSDVGVGVQFLRSAAGSKDECFHQYKIHEAAGKGFTASGTGG